MSAIKEIMQIGFGMPVAKFSRTFSNACEFRPIDLLKKESGPWSRLFGYASRDGYFDKQFGEIQHRFHRGPGWFVGWEKLAVLLIVGC